MSTFRFGLYIPLLLVLWSIGGVSLCAAEELDIEEVLVRMAEEKTKFDPEALKKAGLPGLSKLLDKLFPQTMVPPEDSLTKEDATLLIRQLGAEGFEDRQAATEKLIAEARPFRMLIEEAAQNTDPEIRARAKTILKAWKDQAEGVQKYDVGKYALGLKVYLTDMTDEAMLSHLADRTRLVLERSTGTGGELQLLEYCINAMVKTADDQYTDRLIPLLKHGDEKIVIWMIKTAGSRSGNWYYPRLLLHALQSDREPIVDIALRWSTGCWDIHMASEVKRLSIDIFNGEKEELKFTACFVLMHDHHDKRAMAYLLSQANSMDAQRAVRAISWIGDACNFGRPASPELLETLLPLLKSEDKAMRCRAAGALGTYSGSAVLDALISLLDDPEVNVQEKASRELLGQADTRRTIDRLTEVAKNSESETVRAKAKEILSKLNEKRLRAESR